MAEKEMRSRSSPQAPLSVARAVAKVSAYIGGNDQHKVPAGQPGRKWRKACLGCRCDPRNCWTK